MSRKKRKAQAAEVPDIEASGKDMYDWVQCLIVALIICVVFAFFVRIIDVVGTSMNPTLNNSDKMLVSGLFYKPKVGDVVVFKKRTKYNPNKALVKRVIAVEGQEINIDLTRALYTLTVSLSRRTISRSSPRLRKTSSALRPFRRAACS